MKANKKDDEQLIIMSTYRTPIISIKNNSMEKLSEGPIKLCPLCGEKTHTSWNYDGGYSRGPNNPKSCSWWKRLWGCREKRLHAHQKCNSCGHKWIVGPIEKYCTLNDQKK